MSGGVVGKNFTVILFGWPNSELPYDVGQNLVLAFASLVFVRCSCGAERCRVRFGFGVCVILAFWFLHWSSVCSGDLFDDWHFWFFVSFRFVEICPWGFVACVVFFFPPPFRWCGSHRGGLCACFGDMSRCVCLFFVFVGLWLAGRVQRTCAWMRCVSGVCVGQRSSKNYEGKSRCVLCTFCSRCLLSCAVVRWQVFGPRRRKFGRWMTFLWRPRCGLGSWGWEVRVVSLIVCGGTFCGRNGLWPGTGWFTLASLGVVGWLVWIPVAFAARDGDWKVS